VKINIFQTLHINVAELDEVNPQKPNIATFLEVVWRKNAVV